MKKCSSRDIISLINFTCHMRFYVAFFSTPDPVVSSPAVGVPVEDPARLTVEPPSPELPDKPVPMASTSASGTPAGFWPPRCMLN